MSNPPNAFSADVRGIPIHAFLVPFPIACFVGTFITDLAYWQSANVMWSQFSAWLLAAGLVAACLAALAGLIDLLGKRSVRRQPGAWLHAVGNLIVIGLSFVNSLVHARDGYTAVVPLGLTLSGIVVVILLFTGWQGLSIVHRHRLGDVP